MILCCRLHADKCARIVLFGGYNEMKLNVQVGALWARRKKSPPVISFINFSKENI